MGWSKKELLDRASYWAEKHGYRSITEASLLEWKKEGLIPPPNFRGRGRGLGKAADWSWVAYRRVLKVIQMRDRGIVHRRDQRLFLWLEGNDIPLSKVREDLESIYGANIKNLYRNMRTDIWGQPSKKRIHKLVGKQVDDIFPNETSSDEFLRFFRLESLPTTLIEQIKKELISTNFYNLLNGYVSSFFDQNYHGLKDIIEELIKELSDGSIEKKIIQEELIYGLGSIGGLLSSIESKNPVLEAIKIKNSSDEVLINIRDFILICNNLVKAGLKLFNSTLHYDANSFFMIPGFLTPYLNDIVKNIADKISLKSQGEKLILFFYFLRRSIIRENNAEPLRKIVELRLDIVINWMAENFNIFVDSNISQQEKINLLLCSPLPYDFKCDLVKDLASTLGE